MDVMEETDIRQRPVALISERRSSFWWDGFPAAGDGVPAHAAATVPGLAWKRDR